MGTAERFPAVDAGALGDRTRQDDNSPRVADRTLRGTVLGAFVAGVLLLGAIAFFGTLESRAARDAQQRVDHTHSVLARALELENAIVRMEARHRAFLVSGLGEMLRLRDDSHAYALQLADELAREVADDAAQQRRVVAVQQAVDERYRTMAATTLVAQQHGMERAREGFHAFGSGSIDPVHDRLAELRDGEEALLASRRSESALRADRFARVLTWGTATAIGLLVLAGWVLHRQARRTLAIGDDLRRTNALQEAILQGGGAMIVAVDAAGTVTLFNRAASEALGYRAEEVVGRYTPSIWHDPDEIHARAASLALELGEPVADFDVFTALPDRGRTYRDEWTFVRKDGGRFPADLSTSAVRAEDGTILGFVGIAIDLTARKAAEEAVTSLNRDLAAKAEALAASNRELESFSYSVSHDLRAPLRHIEGYAAMLAEDAGPHLEPEWRRYLDRIGHGARRMGALIDDLLAFSRLARATLQHRPVDMRELALEVARELAPPQLQLEVAELPAVAGDPSLLRQVWTNLLSNAIKYSRPRGGDARIEVRGSIGDDGFAEFQVRDNGVGFDMRYRDKLFGVFQRLHGQDEFEGTGVGLAIVQRIVARHGGHVDASGVPDGGAVFSFGLPMDAAVSNRDATGETDV